MTSDPRKPEGGPLAGRRILIVEDSPIIALETEEMVRGLGGEVVGPAPNMAAARELAEQEEVIDAAVVDINIRGDKAFAILAILARRDIPFLLTSGYADWSMPEEWRERPRLPKPYSQDALGEALQALLGE